MTHNSLLFGDFWSDWSSRFEAEKDVLITPDDPAVVRYAKKIGLDRAGDGMDTVEKVWQSVYDDIEYKLTWEWSNPENTLFVGFGDCEDKSFLLASLMPYAGYNTFEFVIGWLKGEPIGKQEHVWLRVDGEIVDGTGQPGDPEKWTYDEVDSWTVQIEPEKVPTI